MSLVLKIKNILQNTYLSTLAFGLVLISLPSSALANGYQDLHQSADGMATAYATNGTGGDDISAIFSNPASLSRFKGKHVSASISLIVPRDEFTSLSGTSFGFPVTGTPAVPSQFLDTTVGGAAYLGWQLSDRLHFGIAFNAPWATVSDYTNTATSRYIATQTDLLTLNFNPMISYQINDVWSVGGGINIQYYDAQFAVMVDSSPAPGATGDIQSAVSGSDVSVGFTLGVEADFGKTRLGLSYRSKISHDFDGTVNLNGGSLTGFETLAGLPAGSIARTGTANFTIATPWIATFGVQHEVNDRFELYGSAMLVGWSAFKDTIVTYGNGLPTTVVKNGWDDEFYLAVGAGWQVNDQWKLRGGVAWDPTPTPDNVRNPRAPNADRIYVGLGAQYQMSEKTSLQVSWAHTFFDTAPIALNAGAGNTLAGNIDVDADIFMLQVAHNW